MLFQAEGDYRFGYGPSRLQVVRVLEDLSAFYYGHWVWVEGVSKAAGSRPARPES